MFPCVHRALVGVVATAMLMAMATTADARIRIKFYDTYDSFELHAQIYDPDYRAAVGDMRIEAWNALGLIYSVTIPAGACVGRNSNSCVYKNPDAKRARSGLFYVRVLYQAATHGNKIWLRSYGDLSAATEPVMSFRIYMDDAFYAGIPNELFTPTHSGWVGF
jgi:hypothetical protein